jgi:hypothetical protein
MEQKMIQIFREILVELNGYSKEECTDDFVLSNQGHPLWIKIEKILKKKK